MLQPPRVLDSPRNESMATHTQHAHQHHTLSHATNSLIVHLHMEAVKRSFILTQVDKLRHVRSHAWEWLHARMLHSLPRSRWMPDPTKPLRV